MNNTEIECRTKFGVRVQHKKLKNIPVGSIIFWGLEPGNNYMLLEKKKYTAKNPNIFTVVNLDTNEMMDMSNCWTSQFDDIPKVLFAKVVPYIWLIIKEQ